MNLQKLNEKFSFKNKTGYLQIKEGKGGIPVIEIKNNQAAAKLSFQGGHLLSWIPQGEQEVIWLSDNARFEPGKSVRGGIPICWPWFGAHKTSADYPAHGFARTTGWQLVNARQLAEDETEITFSLNTENLNENIQQMWPYSTLLEYVVTIGKTLKLVLTTTNNSHKKITVSEALHTYFKVDNVTQSKVHGLDGISYLDKPDDFKRKQQQGLIEISEEVDRVYLNTEEDVVIENKNREISIKKQGSRSTVVWNPWKDVADKMGDLGEAGYLHMLCVESANAAENTIRLNPGENHTLKVEMRVVAKRTGE